MKESLIFAELLKNLSDNEQYSLLELIQSRDIEKIRDMLVLFLKKYRSKILHLL